MKINIVCDHKLRSEYRKRFKFQESVVFLSSDSRFGNVYLRQEKLEDAVGGPLDSVSLDLSEIAAYVYLAEDSHEVTTLLCRCSPSQVDRMVRTGYYELAPMSKLPEPPRGGLAAAGSSRHSSDDPFFHLFHSQPWELLRWPNPIDKSYEIKRFPVGYRN